MKNFLIMAILLIFIRPHQVQSDFIMPISADLDLYNISVSYGFSGKELTLFGTKDKLDNIAVLLSGPKRNYVITQREKKYGLWLKRKIVNIQDVSSYHALWASEDVYRNKNLIEFYELDMQNKISNLNQLLQDAFIYDMSQKKMLYSKIEKIDLTNNNLFKVKFFIPDNATMGNYLLNIFAFKNSIGNANINNDIIDGQVSIAFRINHFDLNKLLSELNINHPKIYALLSIIVSFCTVFIIRFFI